MRSVVAVIPEGGFVGDELCSLRCSFCGRQFVDYSWNSWDRQKRTMLREPESKPYDGRRREESPGIESVVCRCDCGVGIAEYLVLVGDLCAPALRYPGDTAEGGRWTGEVRCLPKRLTEVDGRRRMPGPQTTEDRLGHRRRRQRPRREAV